MGQMKFSILSGAVKNAGDFLIVDRCIQLLKYVYPDCAIEVFERKYDLTEKLDEINQSDALIFAGGPVFSHDIYPKYIPLVDDLSKIATKIFTVGLGWNSKNNLDRTIYESFKMSAQTKMLLERMSHDAVISCRDWYTIRVIKNQGVKNVLMTGCPAWYDLEEICHTDLRKGVHIPYSKICVSDPGYSINVQRSYEVVRYLREKYPNAQLHYVFHRGIFSDKNTSERRGSKNQNLVEKLKEMNVEIHDISYSATGFKIYDDCDLHVGFRVHAHIYNLSKRNISVLLEEDARACGVNEALGLYGIKLYYYRANNETDDVMLMDNIYIWKNLDDYLFMLETNNYMLMRQAFQVQKMHFDIMIEHLKSLC